MKTLTLLLSLLFFNWTFSADKDWKCIKEDGSIAFTLRAKYTSKFSDGLAAVKISKVINNAWVSAYGFVNTSGELTIPCKYDRVKGKGFVNGRAWVKKQDSEYWTLLDKNGAEIPTGNYEKVGYIFEQNEDLLAVYSQNKLGFINKDGKEVIPCKYTGGTSFEEGLVCIAIYNTEKYGFMNKKGEFVIPMQYHQAGISTFQNDGVCRVNVGGKTVLIERKGNVVFKTKKGNIQRTTLGKIRVFTKSDRTGWGLLGYDDQWIIEPIYDDLGSFNPGGITEAIKNGSAGLIDSVGNVVLDFKYEHIYHNPIKDGYYLAVHKTNGPQSLINTPKDYFTEDLQPIKLDGVTYIYPADGEPLMKYRDSTGKHGYLNRNYEKVIPAKYKKAKEFSEGLAWVLE